MSTDVALDNFSTLIPLSVKTAQTTLPPQRLIMTSVVCIKYNLYSAHVRLIIHFIISSHFAISPAQKS